MLNRAVNVKTDHVVHYLRCNSPGSTHYVDFKLRHLHRTCKIAHSKPQTWHLNRHHPAENNKASYDLKIISQTGLKQSVRRSAHLSLWPNGIIQWLWQSANFCLYCVLTHKTTRNKSKLCHIIIFFYPNFFRSVLNPLQLCLKDFSKGWAWENNWKWG